MTPPSGIRTAQTIGITSAAFVAGGTLCISYLTIPSLLVPKNNQLVRQWKKAFDRGLLIHQIVGAVSLTSFAYLAYKMKGTLDQHRAELYAICAFMDFLLWPWTVLIILPTNKKLFQQHAQLEETTGGDDEDDDSSRQLVQRWGNLNIARGFFPLVASLLGVWATVS